MRQLPKQTRLKTQKAIFAHLGGQSVQEQILEEMGSATDPFLIDKQKTISQMELTRERPKTKKLGEIEVAGDVLE